jgi:hypothetical protein
MKRGYDKRRIERINRRAFWQYTGLGSIAIVRALKTASGTAAVALEPASAQHAYQGTFGIYFMMLHNYGINDTVSYLKRISEHPAFFHNPGFDILQQQGGTIYSIEQPDRFAKILRTMRRATADVIVVDALDTHTDPWSYAMHYFSEALENQPADERQLKWLFWLEFWSSDRYGPEWYGPRWTRWKTIGAPYQSWEGVKQVIDYIWENFAQRPHYYRWNGKPIIVIEADLIGKMKPVWFEQIMADERFYTHFVSDVIHDLADYPPSWTHWVWPYWVEVQPKFNPEWMAALSGAAGEGKHQLEQLFDKQTGKSPMGGNSEPPRLIFIPAYNDYVTGRDPKHAAWCEPLFDEQGRMSRFEYIDELARTLGRERKPIDMDTEGTQYSLQPTITKLSSLLENARQHYGMARVRDISDDEFPPGGEDLPVLAIELYPYRGYEQSKSFDTIISVAVRNTGTAEIATDRPGFTEVQERGDIENVWLIHVSAIDGSRTRVGWFVPERWYTYPEHGHEILRWVGQYPIRFRDKLLVTVDLTARARKGRSIQFELVVDPSANARGVEFSHQLGGDRFSPIRTVRNKYAQVIRQTKS